MRDVGLLSCLPVVFALACGTAGGSASESSPVLDLVLVGEVDELGAPAFSEGGQYVVYQNGSKPVFQNGRQVGYAVGSLSLLRMMTNK